MKRYLKWRSILTMSTLALFVCLAPFALAQDEAESESTAAETEEAEEAKPEEASEEAPAPEPPPPAPEPEAAPAPVAEPPAEPEEKEKGVEEIVVTGSRIRTSPMETPAPILSLSREDIERTGLTSVGDILQRLPASGGSLNTRFNSSGNFGFPPDGGGIGAGSAQVDLRYLGSKRVLVLVDGVRWVAGSSASGVAAATDLNTIPIAIIERIEILEDGASAIYGSDAMAGVVNIITRKEFEGMAANIQVGGFVNHTDGLTQQYDLTWGNKSDRMNLVLNVSYLKNDEVSANDRDISRFATPGFQQCTNLCSSGTPQGRFYVENPPAGVEPFDVTLNDGVTGMPQFDPSAPGTLDFHDFTHEDRFNYASYNLVQTPSERFGIFSALRYELVSNLYVHAKALYNNRKSRNQAAPEPLFIGPYAGMGGRMDAIEVHETNPYNPFGFTLGSDSGYFIGRRPIENGPRIFDQNVNTWYMSGGLQGNFGIGERNFYWDTTLLYSVNRADQIKRGGFNSAKLQKALGPLDVCQADPECVPFNIFGGQGNGSGTITQEMLDYVTFIQKDVSNQELFDFSANISGDLFTLPGGDVGLGAGVELRNYNGFFRPDSVVTAGDSAGVPSSPTAGSYHVAEGYAEMVIPIISKVPGLDLLDVAGAIRVSDYSTFGAEQTFKVGMRWRPIEDIMLRGNYSQGFRAPSIGELFGSEARFDQTMEDPCSDMLGVHGGTPKDATTVANCESLGVPSDGSYQQMNPQISVTTGGNRELKPETSNGIVASVIYSPSWVNYVDFADQLDLEIAYYWIELDNAIQPIDAEIQLKMCVADPGSGLCNGISRINGHINAFNNRLTNIGGITTSGLDITLTYTTPQTSAGRFRVISISNLTLQFDEKIPTEEGFDTVEHLGTELGDPERSYPKFKTSLILGWAMGDFSASITGRYIHSIQEDCNEDLVGTYPETCSNINDTDPTLSYNVLDASIYLDAQVSWFPSALDERLFITVGVNNLLNSEPPICYSCALNGFDATTYDIPGIYGYVRCGYQM